MLNEANLNRRRLIRLAVMLLLVVGVMLALADLTTRVKQHLRFDYLDQQVKMLDSDPLRVQQFVAEQIQLADYQGSLRGPLATLWAGSGSELDRAHLLRNMLRLCGEEAQLVRSGQLWWVESPTLKRPPGAATADWRGDLIPSAASHRLEIEISTTPTEPPLRVELALATLSDDPLLIELENEVLHLRRSSQHTALASVPVLRNCQQLQLVCRTLLPSDLVEFESTSNIFLPWPEDNAAQVDLIAMLVVLTATPPQRADLPENLLSGRLLAPLISSGYRSAVELHRVARQSEAAMRPSLEATSNPLPRYFLGTFPPAQSRADDVAVDMQILYDTKLH